MKYFLLIVAAFLQSVFIPINLVLLLILARALQVNDNKNLLLAFIGGIILGFLTNTNLGMYTLIFLIVVKVTDLFKSSPLFSNTITILFYSFLVIIICDLLFHLLLMTPFDTAKVLWDCVIFVPLYFGVKFWEERFQPKQQLKLKIK